MCIFSSSSSKLKKYIDKNDLQNITSNLGKTKNQYSFKDFIQKKVSPIGYKQMVSTILVSMTIIALKIAFTYNFLRSNFWSINIFNKHIDIASIFSNYYFLFKIFYYFLFSFFIFSISYSILKKVYSWYSKELMSKETKVIKDQIYIGNDDQEEVYLNQKGLYQNILITGSIGSGKTVSAISNILDGLIKNNLYGLVIDIKGNYVETVEKICHKYHKSEQLVKITLNSKINYNPINKTHVNIYEIASDIKKVLTLLASKNTADPFWLDKAESIIRDLLTIMKAYLHELNFSELHHLITNQEYLLSKIELIKENIFNNQYCEEELFNLKSAIANIKNEYMKLDDRTLSIIKAEITRVTSIFVSDYQLFQKFCSQGVEIDFTKQKIVVLSIGIGEHQELSRLIATYLKLDYQRQVLSQKQFVPTFFVCDEFDKIANKEDAYFFSVSREFKSINVVSMQSYNSLFLALQNENASKVMIQNLVNKIWFRNDDIYTVTEIIKQIGKEMKENRTISFSESSQNTKYNLLRRSFKDYKSGLSQSYSLSQKLDYMITEEYLTRKLKTFEAICFLSFGNEVKLYQKVKLKIWKEDQNEKETKYQF